MRSTTKVVFALFASLLLVSVAPASAMDAQTSAGLAVGSQHDSAAELRNAKTLDNVSITGSGDSAYVELTGSAVDSFEDNDLTEYGGDTGSFTTQSTLTTEGAYALNGTASGSQVELMSTSGLPAYPSQGDSFSWSMRTSDASGNGDHVSGAFGVQSESTGADRYRVVIVPNDNSVYLQKFQGGSLTTLDSTNPSVSANTGYTPSVDWQTDGTINVTITDESGSEVTSLGAKDTTYSSGGIGFDVNSDSDGNTGTIDDYSLQSGDERGVYVHNHSVTNSEQAAVNLTLDNATATVTVSEESSGSVLNQTTFSSTGNHTLTWSASSADTIETNVTFETTGSNPTARMGDESILFTPHSPEPSNASPADNETLTEQTATLSVDVNDSDFGTAQGDTVDATFYANGEQVGTDSISSNGTVSTTIEVAGETDWYAELNDSYGQNTTTDTRTFLTPQELRIYNESAPDSLVDNATVQLHFYYDGEPEVIVERNTTDGTINMTDLPADRSFIVVADAEGYLPRRIYVPSLYDTQSIYLLNESREHVNPQFVLEDYTGKFGEEETVMLIQRGLNGSWSTVQGDYFGASGSFPAQLRYNTRHRLILLNTETGERRNLGTETPLTSDEYTIEVRSDDEIVIQRGGASINVNPATRSLAAVNGSSIDITLNDQELNISSWSATAYYQNGSVNQTIYDESFTGPDGSTVSPSFNLSNRSGGNVTVVVSYETADGYVDSETITFGVRDQYDNEYSLLDTLFSLNLLVPDSSWGMLTTFISVFFTAAVTTMIAGSMRTSTEVLGLVAVGTMTGFAVIGWLGYGVVFASGVAWVSFTAVRRGF